MNRFVPNTDKWVSYLLSRGEDVEGRGVDRKALDARIHLDLRQLAGSRIHKNAAEEADKPSPSADFDPGTQVITVLPPDATAAETAEWEERGFIRRSTGRPIKVASDQVDIKQLWKEAMDAWSVTEPRHLFADFLLETGMQKQAAELAMKLPVFAEMIELSGALKKQAGELSQRALDKVAVLSWGGGQYLAGNKHIGAELGYTNLAGTVPLPSVGIRGGNDRFGASAGMAGIFPYLGLDLGGVSPNTWQRNLPRGLPDVIYDKFKGQRPVYLFGRTQQGALAGAIPPG